MHCCPHCRRSYSRKIYFDRHVGVCEFLAKSKKQQAIDIEERKDVPTMRELYTVVMELVQKNKQLEEKVLELSKLGGGIAKQRQQQKMNIIDWLNATYTDATDFTEWLSKAQVSRAQLNILFEADYSVGVTSALKQLLSIADEKRPLRAFETNNVFYVCIDKKWSIMDNETYLKLMYAFDRKVLNEFGEWQKENKDKMYLDDFSLMYNKNVNKVMATREPMYSRVKKQLYSYLKESNQILL